MLTMADVSRVKVRAKLIVLSCCHSGSGEIRANVEGESASESLHQAMKWTRKNGFTKMSEWASSTLIRDDVKLEFAMQR